MPYSVKNFPFKIVLMPTILPLVLRKWSLWKKEKLRALSFAQVSS
jgi:hypothetical protein